MSRSDDGCRNHSGYDCRNKYTLDKGREPFANNGGRIYNYGIFKKRFALWRESRYIALCKSPINTYVRVQCVRYALFNFSRQSCWTLFQIPSVYNLKPGLAMRHVLPLVVLAKSGLIELYGKGETAEKLKKEREILAERSSTICIHGGCGTRSFFT